MIEDIDPYQELVKEKSPQLFCDYCGFYPIQPVHGHFVCPACNMPTTCCEGAPIEAAASAEQHIVPEKLRSALTVPRVRLAYGARPSDTLHHSAETLDETADRYETS